MEEEKELQDENVLFLQELEEENETELTECMEKISLLEQKISELSFSTEEEKETAQNISFFSPVGVFYKRENSELEKEMETLRIDLDHQKDKLSQYKKKEEKIQKIKCIVEQSGRSNVLHKKSEEKDPVESKPEIKVIQILETQEYDRNRIAKDLHDSSVQSLTNLVHKAEFCIRLLDMDKIRVKLELQTMIESIKSVINEMRDIIFNLRPASLNGFSLNEAIETYCQQIKKSYDITIELSLFTEEPRLLQIQKLTLFRIIQEGCNNVLRHAKASKLSISFENRNKAISVTIKDDGVGFEKNENVTEEKDELHGFGLSIMKERVALLGGEITIQSKKMDGTTIFVNIPELLETEKTNG